jgi:thioredoxin-like negative regulator of GroEL
MGQKVRIAKIDATVHRQTAGKYQIKGFPTMILFDIEDKEKPITYEGQRSAEDISQWLNSQKLSKVKK